MRPNWQFLLEDWLRATGNPNTRRFYQQSAGLFIEWAQGQGLHDPEQVKPYHLRLFVEYMEGLTVRRKTGPVPRYSRNGILANLKGLRAFFGHLAANEFIEATPFKSFKFPPREKPVLPVVGYDDFKALMKAALLTRHPLRDQAILGLLFNTGLRVSELCALRFEDFRVEPGYVRVRGKRGKERLVPVDPQVMRMVNAYLRRERPEYREAPFEQVFVADGKRPLDRHGVLRLIHRLCERANLPRLSVHAFRRGFVVELLTMGGDVATAQRILGHESPYMTLHYAQMRDPNLKAVHTRASPGFRRME
ncbi:MULTISPECIES: tyrosine-type recombinase/integrase [unclassified Meiothermus]|uniref:tyrosine-type recombinase/integrase n=1 Tax=unclassified Meiothermus TaxID=370471 RepID=UPI000D7C393F|nr:MULTISPECIES: tyrosine-type recombinase/integrase [unclassified Meiothermus]PZA06508.1 hypothetical protein DNA98_13055 [Meiothermus sp. Pnk-1]RYM37182.1 hypothetical protein EWH23_06815 [Meiothermus sp. PNK-Is4]